MQARLEITAKYARDYRGRSKAEKTLLLDEVVQVTGWSRDNARRRLSQAARPRAVKSKKRQRARKYSFDALMILQKVWAFSGGSCGKYLVVSMPSLLESLERHKEFVPGRGRYSPAVRGELLSMSGATIDRYLVAPRSVTRYEVKRQRNPQHCFVLPSRFAKPAMKSKTSPGSSRARLSPIVVRH